MKQTLVTDGGCRVGRHLTLQLLREGDRGVCVVASNEKIFKRLDRFLRKNGVQGGGYVPQVADLSDFLDCRRVLHGVSTVYHCPAIPGRAEAAVRRRVETMHHLTAALLETFRAPGASKPLFVYQSCSTVPENTRRGRGHFWAETELWRAAAHGLAAVVINARKLSPAAVARAMRLENRPVSEKNLIIRIKFP